MLCPYCGETRFTNPVAVLKGVVPPSIQHLVPRIVQCLGCMATFSEKRFAERIAVAKGASV